MGNAHYFSHDANARNDQKILMLRAECGWSGYGMYFALLEIMFESDETCIKRKALKPLALANNMDYGELSKVVATCVAEGLFEEDDQKIWSHGLVIRKTKYEIITQKRSEAGKKGMDNRWEKVREQKALQSYNTADNTVITPLPQTDNTVITLKETKGKENKEKENTRERESQMAVEVIAHLNKVAGTAYRHNADATVRHINAREAEGYTYEDFVAVINFKCAEWLNTDYAKFLRPETLFGSKFESYLNSAKMQKNGKKPPSGDDSKFVN